MTAQLSGRMRRFRIRVIPGDRVQVGLSPYDPTHGFITFRLREGERPDGRVAGPAARAAARSCDALLLRAIQAARPSPAALLARLHPGLEIDPSASTNFARARFAMAHRAAG